MQECSETASEAELAEIRRRIGTTGQSSRREFLIRLARIAAAIMLPIAGALPTYEWMRRKENRLPLPVDTELT